MLVFYLFIRYFSIVFFVIQELPKLPLPELEETMAEYLRALKPTLTQQQNDRVTAIVKQFISPAGLGPTLHQHLAEKRDAEDNWVMSKLFCFRLIFVVRTSFIPFMHAKMVKFSKWTVVDRFGALFEICRGKKGDENEVQKIMTPFNLNVYTFALVFRV